MPRQFSLILVLLTLCTQLAALAEDRSQTASDDWPWWRGPNRNGVATDNQTPPQEWNEEKNVLWKTPISGRGHGSPTVVGDRIYLATADEADEIQSVVCFDRNTGKQLWKTDIHQGGLQFPDRKPNGKGSMASSTVACDGQRLFINFLNDRAIYTTALSLDGQQLWQQKVADYQLHQSYGSSPAIYGPLVIVTADSKAGGAIAAFDRETGDVVWKHKRPELPNYPSPIILKADDRDQVVVVGCDLVSSFAPLTGKKLWEIEGATTECVTSTVTDGQLIITSGGYPNNHISAVRADGSGEVVWRNNTRVYVPSMLVKGKHLFTITDAGVAICYEMATGEIAWKHRLDGATFTSSPVLVGENIYVTSDDGNTFIFQADPSGFELLGKNKLADQVVATPTICGSRIYMRAATLDGSTRQEFLYCLE
ncbi:MAG: PQQ-binding-like beta-propeller repeat protein [Planctomycetes bacterium]|nr:PQQ-binding-like beta-propeller repeat protein [Planctomycetota bacterium]